MWFLALCLILAGMTKLAMEWLDEAARQNVETEAERRTRQAELDDEL